MSFLDSDAAKNFFANDRFAAFTGIELVEAEVGYFKENLKIEDKHMNADKVVKGGAIFTLADFAFGVAANTHGQLALAINVNISFLKAASAGILYAVAKEVAEPGRLGAYDVLVTNDQEEIIARFNGMVYRKNTKIT